MTQKSYLLVIAGPNAILRSRLTRVTDDGITLLDNAPETPAPLFALKAFRRALLGTPVFPQDERYTESGTQRSTQNPAKRGLNTTLNAVTEPEETATHSDKPRDKVVRKTLQPTSPAKGILLTPGTATSRRKTVSFNPTNEVEREDLQNTEVLEQQQSPTEKCKQRRVPASHRNRRHQTSLTRTLMKLSTKGSTIETESWQDQKPAALEGMDQDRNTDDENHVTTPSKTNGMLDETHDLIFPQSFSGRHWKGEYEEYLKKSTAEMKKVIQQGQNIKYYALQKDTEAAQLNEKLQEALAKISRLEGKKERLAKELDTVRNSVPQTKDDHARLAVELAQQRALTERFRQLARRRPEIENGKELPPMNDVYPMELPAPNARHIESEGNIKETNFPKLQFQKLQANASQAEAKNQRLEAENIQLKQNLKRVKNEMMSYESRRQMREERLKKREERHKATLKQCEMQLAELQAKHERLLSRAQGQPTSKHDVDPSVEERDHGILGEISEADQKENVPPTPYEKLERSDLASPRRRRAKGAAVDVWIRGSSSDLMARHLPRELGGTNIMTDKGSDDHSLREVDMNLFLNRQKQPGLGLSSAENALVHGKVSNRGPLDTISSPVIGHPLDDLPSKASSLHRSFRNRMRNQSPTSATGSGRTSSLSAERAAAAKARLAERKRSAEVNANIGT